MTNLLSIKSPRQLRAVNTLLNCDAIAVKDIGPLIGALNPRQIIRELRDQGFDGIILTRRHTIIDQDGRACRPGLYYIPECKKTAVKEFLTQKGTPTSPNVEVAKSTCHNHSNGGI